MMSNSKHLALWMALLTLAAGCNAPRETIPAINSSSATTDSDVIEEAAATEETANKKSPSAKVDVSLTDFEGLQKEIQKHNGKIVLVDVWSNSCLPCLQEFHNLVELSKQYPDRVTCMSMNVDYIGLKSKPPESALPKVRAFLEKENASSVINFASSEPDSDIFEKYKVDSIPAVIIYDAQGELAAKFTDSNSGEKGLNYRDVVIPKLEELLGTKAE